MLYFIVNPHSRSGQGEEIWKRLERILTPTALPYQLFRTEYPGHAIRLAAKVPSGTEPEPNIIAVMGGDGSLNEVLNGATLSPYTIIAYIPTGSGNDFARGMHLPVEPEKALGHILKPSYVHTLDYGCTTYGEKKQKRRFFVSSGIGYDAAVCHRINNSRMKKVFNFFHLGKLAYVLLGIEQVLKCKMANGTLTIDEGEPIKFFNIAFISCHNLPYEGGGWKFAPGAEPDDGYLDLCVITAKSRLRFTWILLNSLFGARHVRCKGVHQLRCRKASLHLDKALAAHMDGEVVGFYKDLDYACHHEGVKTIW